MKLTTARLKKLIKEELETTLREMEGGEKKSQDYDKLLTLMSNEDFLNSAEILYQSSKNELEITEEQRSFIELCFKIINLVKENPDKVGLIYARLIEKLETMAEPDSPDGIRWKVFWAVKNKASEIFDENNSGYGMLDL